MRHEGSAPAIHLVREQHIVARRGGLVDRDGRTVAGAAHVAVQALKLHVLHLHSRRISNRPWSFLQAIYAMLDALLVSTSTQPKLSSQALSWPCFPHAHLVGRRALKIPANFHNKYYL